MRLHLAYRNIHKGAIRAGGKLFESDPWSGTPGEGIAKMQTWLDETADAYGVARVRVQLRPPSRLGFRGCMYSPQESMITISSLSLLMLFHQFRHHMQFLGRVDLSEHVHPEYDAHGWACSLYNRCDAAAFRRLVFEGGVPGMDVEDLEAIIPDTELAVLSDEESSMFEDLCEQITGSLEPDEDLARAMEEIAQEEGL